MPFARGYYQPEHYPLADEMVISKDGEVDLILALFLLNGESSHAS